MLKYFNIFQNFLPSSDFFLFHTNVSYFSILHKNSFFIFNKTNSYSCSNWLKYYIKILTLILSAALLYRSGGVRNYFLYKATIYLPTKDIKLFGQNGWSVQSWEPWLLERVVETLFDHQPIPVLTFSIHLCVLSIHLLFIYTLLYRAYCKWLYLTWVLCLFSYTTSTFSYLLHTW